MAMQGHDDQFWIEIGQPTQGQVDQVLTLLEEIGCGDMVQPVWKLFFDRLPDPDEEEAMRASARAARALAPVISLADARRARE